MNLFDQLLLEDDQNDELLFLMATAHFNLQSYSMGIEFATELEHPPDLPQLHALRPEVKRLLKDLPVGLAAHPEADKLEGTPDQGMEQE